MHSTPRTPPTAAQTTLEEREEFRFLVGAPLGEEGHVHAERRVVLFSTALEAHVVLALLLVKVHPLGSRNWFGRVLAYMPLAPAPLARRYLLFLSQSITANAAPHTTMRLVELASSPDNLSSGSSNAGRFELHILAVDDAVCEMLKSHPGIAQDAAALLSHGRSGWETTNHTRHSGCFQPPAGTCNHGTVSLVTGVGSLSFDEREVRATVLCAPDELILFAIVHANTYEALICHAAVESRCQSSLFVDKHRSTLFYSTVKNAVEHRTSATETPFWVSIPNGLAFLRIAAADRAHTQDGRCPFDIENTGLFRYYDGKPTPRLRFVLQVDSAKEYTSRWPWPERRNSETASLDALLTFLITRIDHPPSAEGDAASSLSSSCWAGATEQAQSATPSDVATVVAEQLGVVAAASSVSQSMGILRRLKRALEVE